MGVAHSRVLGYLGRALSLELSAVQQYMTQACLVEIWGDMPASDRFRQESVEEMRHAERLMQRMLSLGVAPSASQLKAFSHAPNLAGLLRLDAALEADLIQHYAEAVRFCVLIGDAESEAFFRTLWIEEQHHGEDLAAWINDLGAAGRHRERQRASF